MAKAPDQLSGKEMLADMETRAGLRFRGYVRANDADDTAIQFAPEGDCGRWMDVPASLIDGIEATGERARCGDHDHRVVVLALKPPTSPDGILFAGLLGAQASMPVQIPPPVVTPQQLQPGNFSFLPHGNATLTSAITALNPIAPARPFADCAWRYDIACQCYRYVCI